MQDTGTIYIDHSVFLKRVVIQGKTEGYISSCGPSIVLYRHESIEHISHRESGCEEGEQFSGAEGFSPAAGWEWAKPGEVVQAPLRETVGNEGLITVTVRFSITELKNCKATAGNY